MKLKSTTFVIDSIWNTQILQKNLLIMKIFASKSTEIELASNLLGTPTLQILIYNTFALKLCEKLRLSGRISYFSLNLAKCLGHFFCAVAKNNYTVCIANELANNVVISNF